MSTLIRLRSFILSLTIVPLLVACTSSGPKPQPPTSQSPSTHAPESTAPPEAKPGDAIGKAAIGLLAQLGYDTAKLTAAPLLQPGEQLIWQATVSDDSGKVATVTVDEASLKPLMFQTDTRIAAVGPEWLKTGDKIVDHIASVLGLSSKGYVSVTWQPGRDLSTSAEYRSYKKVGDYTISSSQIRITAPTPKDAPVLISWKETVLPADPGIKISRERAVALAAKAMGTTDTNALHVDLLERPTGPSPVTDIQIVWEVVIGKQIAYVKADDGTVVGVG